MEKKIFYNSDEAAKLVTVTGWVSSDGRFFGKDEHLARYAGSTHSFCECGTEIPTKSYTKCESCRNKAQVEKYNAMPFQEWDGKAPVFCLGHDKYFFDVDDLTDFIAEYEDDNNGERPSLMLVLCDPQELNFVDEDYWCDIMPENADGLDDVASKELMDALDSLNKIIANHPPVSWFPGNIRTEYKLSNK